LLNRRKNDPEFWEPVATLLQSIVDAATEPGANRLPKKHAELLKAWEIHELVQSLREALPGGQAPTDRSALRAFARQLSAPVLGGFLLLGLVGSSGCSEVTVEGTPSAGPGGSGPTDSGVVKDAAADAPVDAPVDAPADAPTDSPVIPPWAENCGLAPDSVLFQTIADSSYDDYTKAYLCECLDQLNTDWNDGLTDLFQKATPERIAAALSEMIECCSYSGPPQVDFSSAVSKLLDGTLCYPPLPYRGVSFPDR